MTRTRVERGCMDPQHACMGCCILAGGHEFEAVSAMRQPGRPVAGAWLAVQYCLADLGPG